MKSHIAILANGAIINPIFHKKQLEKADRIICADGGATHAKDLGFTPDYIIGDFDSVHSDIINFFKENADVTIIEDHDQEKTDLELALGLAESLNPQEISIYGALGKRLDHTLANLYSLSKVDPVVKTRIIDEINIVELIDKPTKFHGNKQDIISVIPISHVKGLVFSGLKWNVDHIDSEPGWFGVSNRFEKSHATINFSEGKMLIVRVNTNVD